MPVVAQGIAIGVALDGYRPLDALEQPASEVVLLDDDTLTNELVITKALLQEDRTQDTASDDQRERDQPVPTGGAGLEHEVVELVVLVVALQFVTVVAHSGGEEPPDQSEDRSHTEQDGRRSDAQHVGDIHLAGDIEVVRHQLRLLRILHIFS